MSVPTNRITIDGKLAGEPKWRHTPSGRAVATLIIEHHAEESVPAPLERLDLQLTVVVIAPLCEQCHGLVEGDHLLIQGALNQKRWLRGGKTRWGKMELIATSIEKLTASDA